MNLLLIFTLWNAVFILPASAQEIGFDQYINAPYSSVRDSLINDGWKTVPNQQIQDTSLYAQDIFNKRYKEVVNCISMERDQCQFVLTKNETIIIVTTKEKTLNVESIVAKNK